MPRPCAEAESRFPATVTLPTWLPSSLSFQSLFSIQPQPDGQQPESDPPPQPSRKSCKPSQKGNGPQNEPDNRQAPSKIPIDFPNRDRPLPPDIIHQLLANPAFYDPLRTPRFPIVLCH